MEYSIINISDTEEGGRSFVGVSNIKNTDKTRIVVPYGFDIPSIVDPGDQDSVARLRRYVRVIQKALHTYNARREGIDFSRGMNNPLAAVSIIQDYLSMGNFIEYESTHSESSNGKLNFKQTIKRTRPMIIDGTLFYDTFITNKKQVIEDNLIAIVQGNIINHFMSHGGDILFGRSLSIQTKKIKLNHYTIRLLKEELNNTFNSRKQNLIRWSIEYIKGLLNPNYEERGEWNYAIVASSLWEIIVDFVFGNQNPSKKDKRLYGKKYSSYSIVDESIIATGAPTEHDTIYEDEEFVFVIDSKMYANQDNLLTEDVLGKQFGYYVEAKNKRPEKTIVNLLFVPYLGGNEGFQYSYIPDPHTSVQDDPDKIIFIYSYSVNTLIDDYYYGRKRMGSIKVDFLHFIQEPPVRQFLNARNTSY